MAHLQFGVFLRIKINSNPEQYVYAYLKLKTKDNFIPVYSESCDGEYYRSAKYCDDRFSTKRKVFVYHGTSSKNIERILAEGVLPASSGSSHYTGSLIPKNPGKIYITSHTPLFWAKLCVETTGGYPVIVELELFIDAVICNDEDYVKYLKDNETTFEKFGACCVDPKHIIEVSGIYDAAGFYEPNVSNSLALRHFVKNTARWEISSATKSIYCAV